MVVNGWAMGGHRWEWVEIMWGHDRGRGGGGSIKRARRQEGKFVLINGSADQGLKKGNEKRE